LCPGQGRSCQEGAQPCPCRALRSWIARGSRS
jgi:hypothetical protein